MDQLQFGLYDAVANFNVGRKATVLIYEKLGMVPGKHLTNGCRQKNRNVCTTRPTRTKNQWKSVGKS